MTPDPTPPTEETRAFPVVRAGGCIVALLGIGALLALNDMVPASVPPILIAVVAMALGVACLALYERVVRTRWNQSPPDVVQLLGRDLGAIRRRRLDDYRLRFPKGTSWKEHILHEILYAIKWLGHLLVFAGLGWILYRLFVLVGWVKP